jgi:hypothetical protein
MCQIQNIKKINSIKNQAFVFIFQRFNAYSKFHIIVETVMFLGGP